VLEEAKRRLAAQSNRAVADLTPTQFYIAGGLAGVANSFISGPVEHVRTRMQVQTSSGEFKSTWDCAKQIYSKYGARGLYLGQSTTMLREWQGYGGYFLVYNLLVQSTGKSASELPTYQIMAFGALAGYGMWIPVYPIDSIKSRIQTDSLSQPRYKGFIDAWSQVVKQEGYGALYRGFGACMLRAAPVNAMTFVAYEWAVKQLSK
jgi:solute carrier family 25 carnitine/acylcarnitine transporter 20/29